MRLARPAILIDILRLPELAGFARKKAPWWSAPPPRQAQAERDPVIPRIGADAGAVLPWGWASADPQPGYGWRLDPQCHPAAEIPLVRRDAPAPRLCLRDYRRPEIDPAEDFACRPDANVDRAGPMRARDPVSGVGPSASASASRNQLAAFGFLHLSPQRAQAALRRGRPLRQDCVGLGGVADGRCGSMCRPGRYEAGSCVGGRNACNGACPAMQAMSACAAASWLLHRQRVARTRRRIIRGAGTGRAMPGPGAARPKRRPSDMRMHVVGQATRSMSDRQDADRRLAPRFPAQWHPCRLRAWRLRRPARCWSMANRSGPA